MLIDLTLSQARVAKPTLATCSVVFRYLLEVVGLPGFLLASFQPFQYQASCSNYRHSSCNASMTLKVLSRLIIDEPELSQSRRK